MCMGVLPAYMSMCHVYVWCPGKPEGVGRSPEVHMAASYHVGAENRAWILLKSNQGP